MDKHSLAVYWQNLDERWRLTCQQLFDLISSWQPSLPVKLWSSMGYEILGFGETSYRYANGKIGKWFIIGLTAHKRYCSLYIWGFSGDKYLLEIYADQLGRVKIGKACLNFQKLEDINLEILRQVIEQAVVASE